MKNTETKKYQDQRAKFKMHTIVNNHVLKLAKKGQDIDFITLCGDNKNIQESSLAERWNLENNSKKVSLSIFSVCNDPKFNTLRDRVSVSVSGEVYSARVNSDNPSKITIVEKGGSWNFPIDSKINTSTKNQIFNVLNKKFSWTKRKEDIQKTIRGLVKKDNSEKTCVLFLDLCATYVSFYNGGFEKVLNRLKDSYEKVDVFFCFSDLRRHNEKIKSNLHHPSFYGVDKAYKLEKYVKHVETDLQKIFKGKQFAKYIYKSESQSRCHMLNLAVRIKGDEPIKFKDHGKDDFGKKTDLKKYKQSANHQEKLNQLKTYRKKDGTYSKSNPELCKILNVKQSVLSGKKMVLTKSLMK